MSDLKYWLALHSLPDVGSIRARRLLSAFGSPENVFRLSTDELKRVEDIGESRARRIVGFNEWERVQEELERAEREKVQLITIHDREYPSSLRQIADAPPLLYVKGKITESDRYAIAVVGSRNSTDYGRRMAEKISSQAASYGLTVVSGMARGIDAASHHGALKAKGRTLAVLGSGVDVPYPRENTRLMGEIQSSGAVISELSLGMPPLRENFPRRNRIISALSLGVIVIEAAVDSGSLITVRYALEQGKEIFAVPGNVTSRNSGGTNRLIKDGARLIESAEEVIHELRYQLQGMLNEGCSPPERPLPKMTHEERLVFGVLDENPKHIDLIMRDTDLSSGKTLSILLSLELKGAVRQVEGKRFAVA